MKMLKLISVLCVIHLSVLGAGMEARILEEERARRASQLLEEEGFGDDEGCCCSCWPSNAGGGAAEAHARSEAGASTHESGRSPAAAPAVAASHHGVSARREGHTVAQALRGTSTGAEGKLAASHRSRGSESAAGAEMLAVAAQSERSSVSGMVNRPRGVLGASLGGRKSAALGTEARTGVSVDAHSLVQNEDAAGRYAAGSGADDGMPRDVALPGAVLADEGAGYPAVTMSSLGRRRLSAGGAASAWALQSFRNEGRDIGAMTWGSLEDLRALGVHSVDTDGEWPETSRAAESATSAISANGGAGGADGSAVASLSAPGTLHSVPTDKLLICPNPVDHYVIAYANLLNILNSQEIIKKADVDAWLAKQVHTISWLSTPERIGIIGEVSSRVKASLSRSSTTASTHEERDIHVLPAPIKSALEADASTKRFMTPLNEGDKYYQPILSLMMELIKSKAIPTGKLVEFIHAQIDAIPTIEASRKAAFAEGIIKGICAIHKIPRKPAVGGGVG